MMRNIYYIAELTIREGRRRSIVRLALIMGVLFLILFGTGLHYIILQFEEAGLNGGPGSDLEMVPSVLTMMGLYVTNFLLVIMSVLISVAAISAEIDNRVIDTIVTKPIGRWQIVLGKWAGFVVMIGVYGVLLAGGVILISYFRTGFMLRGVVGGLAVMILSSVTVMTVTLAGGTRLSTLANGVVAFMLYGLAFIGGWVETIGATFRNETAVNIGILTSLLMPVEALWKKAAVLFQPLVLNNPRFAGPLVVTSEPSDAMLWYAGGYTAVLLLFALWSFGRRDL